MKERPEKQVGGCGEICEVQGSQPISALHRQLKMFLLRSDTKKSMVCIQSSVNSFVKYIHLDFGLLCRLFCG